MSDTERSNQYGAKEVAEILDAVADKIPKMLKGIQTAYYSPEAGANSGKAIGAFYKELIASGIPAETALVLTENYMISLKDLVKVVNNEGKG